MECVCKGKLLKPKSHMTSWQAQSPGAKGGVLACCIRPKASQTRCLMPIALFSLEMQTQKHINTAATFQECELVPKWPAQQHCRSKWATLGSWLRVTGQTSNWRSGPVGMTVDHSKRKYMGVRVCAPFGFVWGSKGKLPILEVPISQHPGPSAAPISQPASPRRQLRTQASRSSPKPQNPSLTPGSMGFQLPTVPFDIQPAKPQVDLKFKQ